MHPYVTLVYDLSEERVVRFEDHAVVLNRLCPRYLYACNDESVEVLSHVLLW